MPPLIVKHWLAAALALPAAMLPAAASASTPEAWDSFRKEVEAACTAAAAQSHPNARIVVDPFGSQSYGIAFLSSPDGEAAGQSAVCIFDKQAKTVEIGGTMALENAVPELVLDTTTTAAVPADAPPPVVGETAAGVAVASEAAAANDPAAPVSLAERLWSTPAAGTEPGDVGEATVASLATPVAAAAPAAGDPPALFAGQCDAECSTTLTALAETDRTDLVALADRIKSAIAEKPDASIGQGPSAVREAISAVADSAAGTSSDALAAPSASLVGTSGCVLYYFGYGSETARTVGRHQCSVTEADGGLRVEKISGERLAADIRPLTDDLSAFVGRTFEAGQSRDSYDAAQPVNAGSSQTGNAVGFAVEEDGRMLLVSSQMRRFSTDDDFFWVLALDRP